MGTATLIPPAFAGLDPIDGPPGFWTIGVTTGSWATSGVADIGIDLQAIDANTVIANNDGSGVSSNGALYFEDLGDIPPGSQIESVQLVVDLTAVGIKMVEAFYYAGAFAVVSLIGADTDDFTGSGTFSSVVMTENPGTLAPWTYDDLYGETSSSPKGFQGWWGLQSPGGTSSPVGTQAYALNYMALIVEWSAGGPSDPTNWTMDAVFATAGKGSREFGMRRKT